jgi:hypothetical protein
MANLADRSSMQSRQQDILAIMRMCQSGKLQIRSETLAEKFPASFSFDREDVEITLVRIFMMLLRAHQQERNMMKVM